MGPSGQCRPGRDRRPVPGLAEQVGHGLGMVGGDAAGRAMRSASRVAPATWLAAASRGVQLGELGRRRQVVQRRLLALLQDPLGGHGLPVGLGPGRPLASGDRRQLERGEGQPDQRDPSDQLGPPAHPLGLGDVALRRPTRCERVRERQRGARRPEPEGDLQERHVAHHQHAAGGQRGPGQPLPQPGPGPASAVPPPGPRGGLARLAAVRSSSAPAKATAAYMRWRSARAAPRSADAGGRPAAPNVGSWAARHSLAGSTE